MQSGDRVKYTEEKLYIERRTVRIISKRDRFLKLGEMRDEVTRVIYIFLKFIERKVEQVLN